MMIVLFGIYFSASNRVGLCAEREIRECPVMVESGTAASPFSQKVVAMSDTPPQEFAIQGDAR
ncbi:hypothetical protein [Sphingomonas sp.]|uniref:hypothetical protein n=1 Tax=Sphingomonas sp. TaxID=28214 RepID=UPI003B00EFD7